MKVIFILFLIFFFNQGCKKNLSSEEKLACLNSYIKTIATMGVYYEVRNGVLDSILGWQRRKLNIGCCDSNRTKLDSAVFFNKNYNRCLFLLVDSLNVNESNTWNQVQTLGGEKIGSKWYFYHVSFPTFAYSLKSIGYKNRSFDYLSKDARLEIINRGFFNPGTCDIDWEFVDSDEWIADWVRKKHQQFLNGR